MRRGIFKTRARPVPSRRRGTAVMETAIVLPMLLFMAFGLAEFGQYFFIASTFEAAARDAARVSIMSTAQQGDPATAATRTLGYSNITFNSSWLTIIDISNSSATVTDVSTIAPGHLLTFTIQTTYYLLPGACRPLYQFTGFGITNSKTVTGQCSMIKE
jgi:Flp pilus assembly protein TadG